MHSLFESVPMTTHTLGKSCISVFTFFVKTAVLLGVIVSTASSAVYDDGLTVHTSIGDIKGGLSQDGKYLMYLGIPYAEVNKCNPFSPSTPYPEFQDVFEANDDSAICPQVDNDHIQGVETFDCLNLNIFTPINIDAKKPLPVMVYLFGGSFRTGSNNRYLYGPKFLVQNDVIIVTINARTGIYGLMCLDMPEVPGNQQLKDQYLGMKWVKKHIKQFGGDDENITLFGYSSGARSVDFHLMSNKEKLFNKVILQSANSLCPPGVANPDNTLPIRVANHLGYNTTSFTDALQYLISAPPKLVATATTELGISMFRACVEKQFDNVESFITQHPLVKPMPKLVNTPVLTGHTYNERLVTYSTKNIESYGLEGLIRSSLEKYFNFDNETLDITEAEVKEFYLGDNEITQETKQDIINFDSDFMYLHPIQRRIKNYINGGAASVYYYRFSFESERNFVRYLYNISDPGATHGDDVAYTWDIALLENVMSPEEQLTVDRLSTMFTNFAKYGDPTPETSELLPVKWEAVTAESLNYLNIGSKLSMGVRPFNTRMSFWDSFFEEYGYLQKGYGDEF